MAGYIGKSQGVTQVDGYTRSELDGGQLDTRYYTESEVDSLLSGIASDAITEGNSSVEVVDTGTGHVAVTVDGSETARFDANGRLGIGTASPSYKTHIVTASSGAGTASGDKDELVVENSTHSGITTLAGNAYESGIFFGHTSDVRAGEIYTKQSDALMTVGSRMSGGQLRFLSGDGTEAARIDSSGNVGIGTSSPNATLDTYIGTGLTTFGDFANSVRVQGGNNTGKYVPITFGGYGSYAPASIAYLVTTGTGNTKGALVFGTRDVTTDTRPTERMRIDSSGTFKYGNAISARPAIVSGSVAAGMQMYAGTSGGDHGFETNANGTIVGIMNRTANDGTLLEFKQDGSLEGTITVSGTTVSYNGGHLARWSRLADDSKDTSIVKGTVMTNLDAMVEWSHDEVLWTADDELPDGVSVGDVRTAAYTEDNEQLNKMAVSSVEGDPNVAGVFVNWDEDDDDFNDMNIAMTGDMVIRIAQGTTVARGDLLMSAGDGTAKPQGDDIVRSKTIAKVTSTNISHTYDDGSYLVPCVLMAC